MTELSLKVEQTLPVITGAIRSDAELVGLFRSGHLDAFDEIDRRYRSRLIKFLCRKGTNEDTAEELVQQTLVQALDHLVELREEERLSVWLYRIASRKLCDEYRKSRRAVHFIDLSGTRQNVDFDLATGEDVLRSHRLDDPGKIVESREEATNLWRQAEKSLTSDEFELLWLCYVDEMNDREIARQTGRTPGAVRVALHRIRKKMLNFLLTR